MRLCILSKGHDGMPPLMSTDRMWWWRTLMACHSRYRLTMYSVQGLRRHATPDFVLPLCFPRAIMAYNAQLCPFISKVKERWWHDSPNEVRLCVLCMVYAGMPHVTLFNCVYFPSAMKARHARHRLTVCCPRDMMTCHARHHLILCTVQVPWWNTLPDVVDHVCN